MTNSQPDFAQIPLPLRDAVLLRWQSFCDACITTEAALPESVVKTLPAVWMASDFVARQCIRDPQVLLQLAAEDLSQRYDEQSYVRRLHAQLQAVQQVEELHAVLRRFRQREMLRIIWRDIAAWADLQETMRDLSHLAEACIDQALQQLYRWQCQQFGTPLDTHQQPMNLIVLGMGKLGAWELNLSSDIDLIFAYTEDGEVSGGAKPISHSEFFIRLGQSLITALDSQTADGFVFRVDMRLRPFGDGGALVSSFASLENYYILHGREWERYAMVKARVVSGDQPAGEQLMAMLRPFVYRRYLDFGAYQAMREMKQLIQREVRRKGMAQNIKLGEGGIREVEFIGQVFQLVRGGRDHKLRARKILKVLAHLGEQQYLPEYVVQELVTAYCWLRTLEHRLQAYADQQTHTLPQDELAQLRLAVSLGFEDWDAFFTELARHRQRVHGHFEQVFEAPQAESPAEGGTDLAAVWHDSLDPAEQQNVLAQAGYGDSRALSARLAELRRGRVIHALSSRGRRRLDQLMPLLLGAAATATQPDITVMRLLDLVQNIARRSVYLSLLVENPLALSQLVRLTDASPWISHFLQKYPLLLDELLDPRSLYAPPGRSELAAELAQQMAGVAAEDMEQSLDTLRHFKHTNVLKVAAADISAALPLRKVSDHLTWIAEVVVDEALAIAWRHLVARHGKPVCDKAYADCDTGFVIVGYGKLGGYELGYSSDLDLVFLHGADEAVLSTDGASPLSVPVFFARLGQRLIHVLTTFTSAGTLYETDMRLRPDGASGLLVSNLKAYADYQRNKAWLWEHQALLRARPVAGDRHMGARFEQVRLQILTRQRDQVELRQGIIDMRERMRASLDRSSQTHFDLKQGSGGLVDIEFLVQLLVLAHAHVHPQLVTWTDNVRLLAGLKQVGLIAAEQADCLVAAYHHYRGEAHRRALAEDNGEVAPEGFASQRQQVQAIWQHWLG